MPFFMKLIRSPTPPDSRACLTRIRSESFSGTRTLHRGKTADVLVIFTSVGGSFPRLGKAARAKTTNW
jgi:hypothetical protein